MYLIFVHYIRAKSLLCRYICPWIEKMKRLRSYSRKQGHSSQEPVRQNRNWIVKENTETVHLKSVVIGPN